tara:strand:+ start:267 stop:719 length:453 start_codon:yes stop_codon:yes gene_type:complete
MKLKQKTDYLKYWKVIRYFAKAKFNLGSSDLDMLLFLYSEGYFNRSKFVEYNEIFKWDSKRFYKLRKDGWIDSLPNPSFKTRESLYTLSHKASTTIDYIYKKLNDSPLPTDRTKNPIFRSNRQSTDFYYRKIIVKMNEAIKLQQHPFPEL